MMLPLFRIGLALALTAAAAGSALAIPEVGTPAPRFALRDLRDNTVLVSSKRMLTGQTTLVSFFATWCKPCKQEIGELRALQERYADRNFRVVLVCLDKLGVRDVEDYLAEAGSGDLLVLWDRYGRTQKAYSVVHLPTNVLVGPDERVRMVWETYQAGKLEQLNRHLAGLPALELAGEGDEP